MAVTHGSESTGSFKDESPTVPKLSSQSGQRARRIEADAADLPPSAEWSGRLPQSESDLVTRRVEITVPIGELATFLAERSVFRARHVNVLLDPAKGDGRPYGVFEQIFVNHESGDAVLFDVKQTVLLPPARPLGLLPSGVVGGVTRIAQPNRMQVLNAMAKTLGSPPFLVSPQVPAGIVWDYLMAREGFHIRQSFGAFP